MKNKVFSLITIFLLLLPVIAEVISISLVTSSDNVTPISVKQTESSQVDTDLQEIVLQIGNITLTINVKEPARRTLITFEAENTTITEEIVVTPSSNGYTTSIYLDGRLIGTRVRDLNILEPIKLTTASFNALSSNAKSPSFRASYTYKDWDSIRYVTGPSYQIKYPHPDRDWYSIATFNDWSRTGTKLIHSQFNEYYSGFLAGVGWAGIFAAVGAYMGLQSKNAYYVVIGAVIGVVLGFYFGYATQAILADEEGCIWWWSSRAYNDWLAANGWWIWFFNIMGSANAFVWAAFALYGYLRIGSHTFYDAVYAGSP